MRTPTDRQSIVIDRTQERRGLRKSDLALVGLIAFGAVCFFAGWVVG